MPDDVSNSTPWLGGSVLPYTGAFRDNVRAFLTAHGTPVEDVGQPNVSCWMVPLQGDDSTIRLYIYQEELDVERPAVCDACRIIGEASCKWLLMAPSWAPSSPVQIQRAFKTRACGIPGFHRLTGCWWPRGSIRPR